MSWADFCFDLNFFLSGYLIYAEKRFKRALRRDRWFGQALGVLAFSGLLITMVMGDAEKLFSNPEASGDHIFWGIAAVDASCFSTFMLDIGMRFLDFSNRWTRYGQEAIVPFYVLHQPIILAIAFFVVQWSTDTWIKKLVVIPSSFFITTALYELLVR
jgi:glucan biosynthesis protein C